jgi:hypothetical protein
LRRILLKLAAVPVVLYLAACLYMFTVQRGLLFPVDTRDVALDVGTVPNASVVAVQTSDGETLKAWWVPPGADQVVYLYFHGNSETLESRNERFALLTSEGAGLLATSWRGYGGSTGVPSEAGLRRDALAAYEWLRRQGAAAQRVIVFGESLGTGVALGLIAVQPVAALVLDSPYTAIYHVAEERYPWLPVALLARDPFDSLALVDAATLPVLVFHCTEDRVVPYRMGQALFAALPSADKHFETVAGRCHVPSVALLLPLFRELERKVRAG